MNNDYSNDTTIDEYTKDNIEIMLTLMLFISCCPTIFHLCKGLFSICKDNFTLFRFKIYKIKSQDNLLLDECSICLESYIVNDKIIYLNCGHIYHKDCIKSWLKKSNTCPHCREIII
jgi:hypothetical protein